MCKRKHDIGSFSELPRENTTIYIYIAHLANDILDLHTADLVVSLWTFE